MSYLPPQRLCGDDEGEGGAGEWLCEVGGDVGWLGGAGCVGDFDEDVGRPGDTGGVGTLVGRGG